MAYLLRDALVVDTTNFTDKTRFRGTGENLHVVERFTRISPDTILYKFTIDDPSIFTKPWTAESTFVAVTDRIFEYACRRELTGRRKTYSRPAIGTALIDALGKTLLQLDIERVIGGVSPVG